jgi:UDP-N-acetylglucosamine acyltransferase
MSVGIHPRAEVDLRAELGAGVEVGPFAVIEAGVIVGEGTRVLAGAHLRTGTTLGCENLVRDHAVLGGDPQDTAYGGEETFLSVGDRNIFGEGCTLHRGTTAGSETQIGNDCFFMANSHAGHNCIIDDQVVLANGALLGGHVHVGARAFVSGNTVVHQHLRVGRLAMLGGGSTFTADVPPFMMATEFNVLRGLNVVGLRRAGIERASVAALRRAYRHLFGQRRNLTLAREALAAEPDLVPEVEELLAFLVDTPRGLCKPALRTPATPHPSK